MPPNGMVPRGLPVRHPIAPRVRTGGGAKAGSALRSGTSKAGAAANRAANSVGRGLGSLFRGMSDAARRRKQCECRHACCCQNQDRG